MSATNWTRDAAAHLLRRAGFGGTPSEIDDLHGRGLEGAVSRLVDYEAVDLTAYEAALAARNYNLLQARGLQQWFMDRMAFSPRPLQEKMTYFWNLHCRFEFHLPFDARLGSRIEGDGFYRFLERTWRWQQLPWALLFLAVGGWPWLIWGTFVRVAVSTTGHWFVGYDHDWSLW